jgi:hypothetical protein
MIGAVFEEPYKGQLWRLSIVEYKGAIRLAVWAHYQDRTTGEWKPCGGKRETPGFFIPLERQPDLEAAVVAIGEQLRSKTR